MDMEEDSGSDEEEVPGLVSEALLLPGLTLAEAEADYRGAGILDCGEM